MQQLALDFQPNSEPSRGAEWQRRFDGALTPARRPIYEGRFVRFNGFYDVVTGKLDKHYLRVCAVHRLYDRCKIGKERAIAYLKGAVPKGAERSTVECWRANPNQQDKGS